LEQLLLRKLPVLGRNLLTRELGLGLGGLRVGSFAEEFQLLFYFSGVKELPLGLALLDQLLLVALPGREHLHVLLRVSMLTSFRALYFFFSLAYFADESAGRPPFWWASGALLGGKPVEVWISK